MRDTCRAATRIAGAVATADLSFSGNGHGVAVLDYAMARMAVLLQTAGKIGLGRRRVGMRHWTA